MKLIILAFILSLSLHFLLFSSYKKKEEPKQSTSTPKHVKKSSVHYVRLISKPKSATPVKKPVPKKVAKIEPNKFKYVQKKKIVPQKRKPVIKKPKKIIPKPIKRIKKTPIQIKDIPIKPQQKRKTIPKKSLENFLLSDPLPVNSDMLSDITKSYLKVYGEEYNSLTKVQKVFIQNNITQIAEITRKYYQFPSIATRLKKNDYNVVKFILYPNGDISDLEIVVPGKYSFYDKSILETIEIAYKDYPRPKKPTPIKFFIKYRTY